MICQARYRFVSLINHRLAKRNQSFENLVISFASLINHRLAKLLFGRMRLKVVSLP